MKQLMALLSVLCLTNISCSAQDARKTLLSFDDAGHLSVPNREIKEVRIETLKGAILAAVDSFEVTAGQDTYSVRIEAIEGSEFPSDKTFQQFSISHDGQDILSFRNDENWVCGAELTSRTYTEGDTQSEANRYAQIFRMDNGCTVLLFTGWVYASQPPCQTIVAIYKGQAQVVYNQSEKLQQLSSARVDEGGYFEIKCMDQYLQIPLTENKTAEYYSIIGDAKGVYIDHTGTYSFARDGCYWCHTKKCKHTL